jgi:DNA polymerase III gamma/tau subunit
MEQTVPCLHHVPIIEEILKGTVSTSPSVLFNEESQNIEITNEESGTTLLIEGKPFLLDHIALVTEECGTNGVWDKGNGPSGVDISNKGNLEMNEEDMKKLLEATIGGLASTFSVKLDALATRMDSMEQGTKARADAEAAEKEKKEQERADAEAEEKKAKEEKERADSEAAEAQARADAETAAAEKAKADAEEKVKVEEEIKSDAEAMATEQVKADSAFSAIGQKAPSPHAGELSADYIKRTLSIMQKYAPSFAQANIRAIADSATLKTMQNAIFDEAKKEFERKVTNTPGRLIEMVRNDAAGRPVRTYQGDMDTWLRTVKVPAQKLVKFNNGSMH